LVKSNLQQVKEKNNQIEALLKSNISNLNKKNISINQSITNLETSRVLVSPYQTKITEIESSITNNKEIFNKFLKDDFDQLKDIVTHLCENDKSRIEETNVWVPLILGHDRSISDLKQKTSKTINPKFSVNSNGNFFHENKKTMFFSPGIMFPEKSFIHSLYMVVNIKSNVKCNRKFELISMINDVPKPLYTFEKDCLSELIFEDFIPPLEISPKTKILLTCDRKVEGMVTLTLSY